MNLTTGVGIMDDMEIFLMPNRDKERVREAARSQRPLNGFDAKALEGALTMAECDLRDLRAELLDSNVEVSAVRRERDKIRERVRELEAHMNHRFVSDLQARVRELDGITDPLNECTEIGLRAAADWLRGIGGENWAIGETIDRLLDHGLVKLAKDTESGGGESRGHVSPESGIDPSAAQTKKSVDFLKIGAICARFQELIEEAYDIGFLAGKEDVRAKE